MLPAFPGSRGVEEMFTMRKLQRNLEMQPEATRNNEMRKLCLAKHLKSFNELNRAVVVSA